ncbi:hypothetical protein OsI_08336 [Oryza sativa Indica Group]|uniref:Uncharacterized protein n=1 Tax=Oryza sativa subsp. indica TaxID=39946 RepID=A2X7Z0_ORYSI|nr:hypothetical protein OsI_08336 [Oryza sativa Indica Group]
MALASGGGGRLGAGSAGEETGVTGSGGPGLLTGRSGGSLGGSGGGSTDLMKNEAIQTEKGNKAWPEATKQKDGTVLRKK